jgi:hypothetical protein
VILLVVMALLALFSVITITFVLVSSQSKRTAVAASRQELRGDSPQMLLDQAFYQVVRGTNNKLSVLQQHSLLEDMYGLPQDPFEGNIRDGAVGYVSASVSATRHEPPVDNYTNVPTGPILRIVGKTLGQDGVPESGDEADLIRASDKAPAGYYTGQWITFTSGSLSNQTFQILDCRFDYTTGANVGSLLIYAPGIGIPANLDRFVINGRPFNGTGFGCRVELGGANPRRLGQVTTPWVWSGLDLLVPSYLATDPWGGSPPTGSWPYALLPNPRNFQFVTGAYPLYAEPAGHGGADEPYDAKDFQNVILARPASLETAGVHIPSLHDPALVNFGIRAIEDVLLAGSLFSGDTADVRAERIRKLVMQPFGADYLQGTADDPIDDPVTDAKWQRLVVELKRKFMLRPLREDNPKFTGSNPYASAIPATAYLDPATRTVNPYWEITGGVTAGDINHWDVDNDGDGVPDSIWVDLGMPVQTMPDGRRYKPIYSILCLDLDGRINLNAHGTYAQLLRNPAFVSGEPNASIRENVVGPQAGTTATATVPIGQGWGPADVNLRALLDTSFHSAYATSGLVVTQTDLINLLTGKVDATTGIHTDGRYGESHMLGSYRPAPGMSCLWNTAPGFGISGFDDDYNGVTDDGTELALWDGTMLPSGRPELSNEMHFRGSVTSKVIQGSDINFADDNKPIGPVAMSTAPGGVTNGPMQGNMAVHATQYGSPPDLNGAGTVTVDMRGQPFYAAMDCMVGMMDDPYELNLFQRSDSSVADLPLADGRFSSVDAPFSPSELERLLRPYDVDTAGLPNRIGTLAANLTNPVLRYVLTTESWDVPCDTSVPWDLPSPITAPPTPVLYQRLSDAVRQVLLTNTVNAATYAANPSLVDRAVCILLGPELISGLKIDLNRPLGDGHDNGGDGTPTLAGLRTVDDPLEAITLPGGIHLDPTDRLWRNMSTYGSTGIAFDHNNNGFDLATEIAASQLGEHLARQYLARQLYVIAMLLKRPNFFPDPDGDGERDDIDGNGVVNDADTAMYLAQWAINAVDFRDRDSIMTPFEYDVDPFTDVDGDGNPWDVDGLIDGTVFSGADHVYGTADDIATPSTDDTAPGAFGYRRLIWGCERPELLLTETLATHNHRTEDLTTETAVAPQTGGHQVGPNNETTPPTPADDDDYDQRLRPVGSLFVEIYNPWSLHHGDRNRGASTEMYSFDTATDLPLGVDLGKVHPTSGNPIWRMAITANDPAGSRAKPPEEKWQSGSSDNPRWLYQNYDGSGINEEILRTVYFVQGGTAEPTALTGITDDQDPDSQRYWMNNGNPAPVIKPGRFALVGPGDVPFGAFPANYTTDISPNRRIRLAESVSGTVYSNVSIINSGGTPDAAYPYVDMDVVTPTNSPNNEIMQAPADLVGIVVDRPHRLSVSEPTIGEGYYTSTGFDISTNPPTYVPPLDVPLDKPRAIGASAEYPELGYYGTNGTLGNAQPFRYIHLQRLANPMLPWHKDANPYITIDTMAVDLTVYDSESEPPSTPAWNWVQIGEDSQFDSRQRVGSIFPLSLWSHKHDPTNYDPFKVRTPVDDTPTSGVEANPLPQATLGYLNTGFGTRWNRTTLEAKLGVGNQFVNEYIGTPNGTLGESFSWLLWNNRPYMSATELMTVPYCRASQLTRNHSMSIPLPTYAYPYVQSVHPFVHQVNVIGSSLADFTAFPTGAAQPAGVSDLYRIFDYVDVPSRFSGTEELLDPNLFSAGLTTGSTHLPDNFGWARSAAPSNEIMRLLRPPFNRLSTRREPGKVNINSILTTHGSAAAPESVVWRAVSGEASRANSTSDASPDWNDIVASRRGYAATTPVGAAYLNDTIPTLFANPFRPYNGNAFVPLPALQQAKQVDVTLFRSRFATHAPGPPLDDSDVPLLEMSATTGVDPYRNVGKHTAFHYQLLNRLKNLVTTRSNVYAVWITVGYFEVEPVRPSPGNPDGLALGAEIGTDTGDVKRHRAFYIFDRTIPMAFERGENHNVDNGVLVRRFIE